MHIQKCCSNCVNIHGYRSFLFDYLNVFFLSFLTPTLFLFALDYLSLFPNSIQSRKRRRKKKKESTQNKSKNSNKSNSKSIPKKKKKKKTNRKLIWKTQIKPKPKLMLPSLLPWRLWRSAHRYHERESEESGHRFV